MADSTAVLPGHARPLDPRGNLALALKTTPQENPR